MKAMSSYLKKLEKMATPSRSAVRATSIHKLLKKIKNLDEIPRDDKFSFKERAAKVLEKWKASWGKEDLATSSTVQPISNHNNALSAIPDDRKPADSSDARQLLENYGKSSATSLTEECQLGTESEPSCKLTSDQSIEAGLVPANENPLAPTSPVLVPQYSSKSRPERQVIDLTDDSEAEIDTGSELPHQPTNHLSSEPGVVKGVQTIRSSLLPGQCSFVLFLNDLTRSCRYQPVNFLSRLEE